MELLIMHHETPIYGVHPQIDIISGNVFIRAKVDNTYVQLRTSKEELTKIINDDYKTENS
jgi:hypothetical protein